MRYLSLDFFRGLTVAFMILVNNPGSWAHVYPPLRHADWHGCTPTDLVFPFFLFIVGVSMFFSFEKIGHRLNRETALKIGRRTALIFGVGLLLNWFPFFNKNVADLRIFGVLQRIALSFGLAAVICLGFRWRGLAAVLLGILLGYWAILVLFAAPGADPFALVGNAVQRLDLFLFGEKHLYHGFRDALGERVAFDPEGFLGMISGAATVILGYFTGRQIRFRGPATDSLVRDLLLFGLLLVVVGQIWGLFFPINKPLWTSSYVLNAGGLAMILLAACIWLIDKNGWTSGTGPFIVFGKNPLFAFVLSGILVKTGLLLKWKTADGGSQNALDWIYETIFRPIDGFMFGSLLYAISFVGVCWLVCWLLYRRGIFIKI